MTGGTPIKKDTSKWKVKRCKVTNHRAVGSGRTFQKRTARLWPIYVSLFFGYPILDIRSWSTPDQIVNMNLEKDSPVWQVLTLRIVYRSCTKPSTKLFKTEMGAMQKMTLFDNNGAIIHQQKVQNHRLAWIPDRTNKAETTNRNCKRKQS